jgi:hypothetical protein
MGIHVCILLEVAPTICYLYSPASILMFVGNPLAVHHASLLPPKKCLNIFVSPVSPKQA